MTRSRFPILVIDDHAPTRTLAQQVLAMRGHLYEAVDTALAAVRAVDSFESDVAILDGAFATGLGSGSQPSLARDRAHTGARLEPCANEPFAGVLVGCRTIRSSAGLASHTYVRHEFSSS